MALFNLLLEKGANIDSIPTFNAPPLAFAVASQNKEAFKKLLDLDADVNVWYDGKVPIWTLCVQFNEHEFLTFMIEKDKAPFLNPKFLIDVIQLEVNNNVMLENGFSNVVGSKWR